jgi:hypothetical protein
MTDFLFHAFQQAPWRVQIQRFGLFFLGLVIFGLSAGIYLNITANSYALGVDVQTYEERREELQRSIADMQTLIASNTTSQNIEKKANDLHFKVPYVGNNIYLPVPGYTGRQLDIHTNPAAQDVKHSLIKPAFTQSLWEYLAQGILTLGNDFQSGGQSR